jgi:hypothetical protein
VLGGQKSPWSPRSDSFEWLLADKRHRRSNLRLIGRSIRDGWLDGPKHAGRRAALLRTLRQLERRRLTDRELLALNYVYLAMFGAFAPDRSRLKGETNG